MDVREEIISLIGEIKQPDALNYLLIIVRDLVEELTP